jgi:hypothetical protein
LADVATAPLHVASFGKPQPLASAPFAHSTVKNYILSRVGVNLLEMRVLLLLGA